MSVQILRCILIGGAVVIRRNSFVPLVVGVLLVAQAGVEAALLGADLGLWGSPLWRMLAYQYGGFWAGLLRDWQPNYPGQPVVMFVSHSFLHAGPGHLVGNALALAILGQEVVTRFGPRAFIALYCHSALGGALAFGVLTQNPSPMVGASGAIFGLASAVVLHEGRRRSVGWRWLALAALIAAHPLTWALTGGHVAWETHLGGSITGFALAIRLLRSQRLMDGGTS